MKDYTDFCRTLVKDGKQVDVNAQDCNGNTALHLAGYAGAQETWDELLRLNVKQKLKNNQGQIAEMKKDVSGCSIMWARDSSSSFQRSVQYTHNGSTNIITT